MISCLWHKPCNKGFHVLLLVALAIFVINLIQGRRRTV